MKRLLVLAVVVVLLAAGCSALSGASGDDGTGAGAAHNDPPPIKPSAEAAMRLFDKVSAASQRAGNTGSLTLTITDQEVTSFLNLGTAMAGQLEGIPELGNLADLQKLSGEGQSPEVQALVKMIQERGVLTGLDPSTLTLRLAIRQPQVRFMADGRILVRGQVAVLFWKWPVRIVVAPRASSGELVLDFVEGSVGRIAMPEFLFDLVGKGLARGILAGQALAEVSKIEVADGTLTVSGRKVK